MLTNTGKVISFGKNDHGQCGHGCIDSVVKTPTIIASLAKMDSNIKFVATGTCHSIVASDHHVYTFGSGRYGRLGHGNFEARTVPTRVEYFEKLFSGGLTPKNHLFIEQVACSCDSSMVLDNLGSVYIMGIYQKENQITPVKILINSSVRFVAGGDFFVGLITCNNELYTFGDNSYGQIGNNSIIYAKEPTKVASLSGVHKICCGSNNMAALTERGRVYTWGKSGHGRLGHAVGLDIHTPKELVCMMQKDVKQMDASSDYIIFSNSECFDDHSKGALGPYRRKCLKQIILQQFNMPFGDIVVVCEH